MRRHGSLLLLLGLSLALYVTGIHWGLPSREGWEYDETMPANVHRSLRYGVGGGWVLRYPPFHFRVLGPLFQMLGELYDRGVVNPERHPLQYVQFLLIRGVSVAMATATVLLVFLAGQRIFGRRAALLGAALHAFSLTAVYYAKVGNLDVPYIFWFSLALLAYVRLLAEHRWGDYLLFAAAAGAAVSTKDQAYSLFVLAPLAIVWSRWHAAGPGPPLARARRTLLAGRVLALPLVAALVFAYGHQLPGRWDRFVAHVRLITTPETGFPTSFPAGLGGQLSMLVQLARQFGFTLGWPGFLACLAGLGLVAARRRTGTSAAGDAVTGPLPPSILLLAASCYLTLLAVIRSLLDRYLMGPQIVLALFGGYALDVLLRAEPLPRWARRCAVSGVLTWSFLRAVSLDLNMLGDTRYAIEAWAAEREAAGEHVFGMGRAKMSPRLPLIPWRSPPRRAAEVCKERHATWVVMNTVDLGNPIERVVYDEMQAGHLGFHFERMVRTRPWLSLIHTEGIYTNLMFVNPRMAVFRRTD